MGRCKKCMKEIILKEGEKNCPNCGELPFLCHQCQEDISGEEEECSVCGYFICENCGLCAPDCDREIHSAYVVGEIEDVVGQRKNKHRAATNVTEYFYATFKGKRRLNCEPRAIPISYAYGKNLEIALRMQGYKTKNPADTEKWNQWFKKISQFPLGHTWTISQEKDDGTKGEELRMASNFSVCMGLATKKVITKDRRPFDVYEIIGIGGTKCPYAEWDNLITKHCRSCKTTNKISVTVCDACGSTNLRERVSYKTFCQLPRERFIPLKKEVINDVGEGT